MLASHTRGRRSTNASLATFACLFSVVLMCGGLFAAEPTGDLDLVPLKYNRPGMAVDLGVGLWAWPLPMDWDSDGDLDLVVSCPDKPMNGTYFFENTTGNVKFPVFRNPVKVGPGMKNAQVSHVEGQPHVLQSDQEYVDFLGKSFTKRTKISAPKLPKSKGNRRFSVWSYVDYDGDGLTDIMAGTDDWGHYGWDDGYDESGKWRRGPLHGYVYIYRNVGDKAQPKYQQPQRLSSTSGPINVYGNPQPNMADFDGDGDLDLICGEFLDGFNYFQNVGSRTQPKYADPVRLRHAGQPLHMHVQMITPTAIDWDQDGDVDLICGDEDGRVALLENTGRVEQGQPDFLPPRYFQQQADDLKFGALVTPVSVDWDEDGDEDLVCGNTSGNICWFENLDGKCPPSWSAPQLIQAAGTDIHIQAGGNGSIQGPAEAKWGYTTLSVADWDHDGRLDLVVNSILGRIDWFRNVGQRGKPQLEASKPVRVRWAGQPPKPDWTWWKPGAGELVTQWRTTPVVADWDQDGLNDLLVLDHEGYLAWFRRQRVDDQLILQPGRRVFQGGWFDSKHRTKAAEDQLLRLNRNSAGGSGRRKLCLIDWDGDGRRDLLVNSVNVSWLKNASNSQTSAGTAWTFEDRGQLSKKLLAGHTTSPTTADWDGDGSPELIVGAEDGRLYWARQ